MEYIQTILFQIPASQLEQASEPDGLLPELDEHRNFLHGQPGFRDIRITRSINNEGNVLVVVETRWSDDSSLVRYETNEPNAATIVRKHEGLLVRDSLQVLDMEALRTEASFRQAEAAEKARERVVLPIVIPVGVLAFALLVIYGLSRIYLEIGGDGAVALAAGLAIGALLVAFYFANNPRAPGWQIAGVIGILVIALAAGTTWALVEEDEQTHAENGGDGGGDGNGNGGGGGGDTIVLDDFKFVFDGAENPDIPLAAGQEMTFQLTNEGATIHNIHVDGADEDYAEAICEVGGDNTACSDPAQIRGGDTGTLTIQIDAAGTYHFRCDFHPTQMTGTFTVE